MSLTPRGYRLELRERRSNHQLQGLSRERVQKSGVPEERDGKRGRLWSPGVEAAECFLCLWGPVNSVHVNVTGTLLSVMEGSATRAHTGKVQAFPFLPLGPSVLKVMG